MITVAEAEKRILEHIRSYGTERVALAEAQGRVLAEAILADRDIPPYDRSTMDGVAIRHDDIGELEHQFPIVAIQAAGDTPLKSIAKGSCVQIMTGAAVPDSLDTVVPIEEVTIEDGRARIATTVVTRGQFIHSRGADNQAGDVLVEAGQMVTPAIIPIAATVGQTEVVVSKVPRAVVMTTGDELVDIAATPQAYQVRRSNNYAVKAVLDQYGVQADMIHVADDPAKLQAGLKRCIEEYDVVLVSGGVSKGEFDYVPKVMADLSVEMHFHGVLQKPGKPLWFGTSQSGAVVFALPGNPVSTFFCVHKYVLPWLRNCLGATTQPDTYAVLGEAIEFTPKLHYYAQVSLNTNTQGQLVATPLANNGSGDFISLVGADAFIELPPEKTMFKKGEAYKIVPLAATA